MFKSLIGTCSLLAALGLSLGGCAATPDDGADDALVTVAAETSVDENAKAGVGVVTLVNNLGSGQGATAAASNGTTAVRWPASALKGSFSITSGQPCSTAAAAAGTVLSKSITLSGSFAYCN